MNKASGVEKMVWLVSCKGYNMKYNGDLSFARELLDILQVAFFYSFIIY